ncbi:MAG: C4-dicarboxylate ABC transporter permease [Firmicutes bacterium HGW-Firmicutes-12]|nr:MAG: C4-dicarboxylate ABC transporter permease [Firmicutes bacterium HGW-Firmicutes-12]
MTLVIFVVLLLTSMPIAVCLGLASVVTLFIDGIPLSMAVQRMLASTNSFPIMAILFFMLSGEIMSKGNMTKKLISVAEACVGFIKGGLAISASLASIFFSAISGSSAATCASIGTIMIEQMEKKGYKKDFAAAVIAASGITGIVIPPSITLVVYGVVTGTSVGKLFIGGLVPGFIMGLSIAALSIFLSYKYDYGEIHKFNIKEIWSRIKESAFVLMMPIIILGGIYGGIFTPTEAAVVSVVYALIITLFVERSLEIKDLGEIFIKSVINAAVVLVIIQNASVFSWILTNDRIPHAVGAICASISQSKIVFLMLMNIVFLIAGTLVTGSAIVAILAPIFLPVALQYGIDPVFLGVLMVINLAIGYITPPVGVDLYVAGTIAKIPIERVIRQVIPYLLILLVDLIIITYVPGIIMFLPNLM